ncbi:NmrA-like family domain-containing protein 1 [Colletotrichum trifolii]|uniref:NmrA-like family domain-containing protein 1 n=1 Tax=Colletotrichum trifolii TaxID=5466 RepID=A0A4R8R4Z4_COLTR|nr:NmrA-like family domain-containing protein 1 [Colletotrichum trifolii]
MTRQTIFVAGATGIVGGAVAKQLLQNSIAVRALVRNPDSPSAKNLALLGATLVPGDYDNNEALDEAVQGISGAFLNLMPDFVDHSWELKAAKRIMAAAKKAGAKHFIYSSGFAVQAPEKLKHWDPQSFTATVLLSKQSIERELRRAGFESWTILRPGNFMSNYLLPQVGMYPDLVQGGRFVNALRPSSMLPMVDTEDIGKFAVAAYRDAGRFNKQEIPISGELLTADDIMAKLEDITGRKFEAVYLSDEEVEEKKGGDPFLAGQLAMRDMAQFADPENTRSWGIQLGSFEEYLDKEKLRVKETYGQLA